MIGVTPVSRSASPPTWVLDPATPRLFVIDGTKALRSAVPTVFGEVAVQRCRVHKLRNVCDQLPEDQAAQTRSIMKAAMGMSAKAGIDRLREHIQWLKRAYPSAGASLEEGLEELFTVNRLELPPRLARVLSTTNMIESPNSALRRAIGRVTRWREGSMVLRWVGRALTDIEQRWRVIPSANLLWILRQNLQRLSQESASLQPHSLSTFSRFRQGLSTTVGTTPVPPRPRPTNLSKFLRISPNLLAAFALLSRD